MKNLWKGILLITVLLCSIFIVPFEIQAAEVISDVKVEEGKITFTKDSSIDEICTDTQYAGKKKVTTDSYGDTDWIDVTFLKGKEATIDVYPAESKKDKVSVHVLALRKKVKVKFLPKTITYQMTCNGSEVKAGTQYRTIAGSWKDFTSDTLFQKYTMKGTTLYFRLKDSYDASTNTYTPSSKEIKVKVPKKPDGPNTVLQHNTITFKLPKGCSFYMTDGKGATNSALEACAQQVVAKDTTINAAELITKAGIDLTKEDTATSYAAIFCVKRDATDRKLESKETKVYVPWQTVLSDEILHSSTGLEYSFVKNYNQTQATGVKITNHTTKNYQVAVLPEGKELSDYNIAATSGDKKITWFTVSAGKSYTLGNKVAKQGSRLMYREPGVAKNTKTNTPLKIASTIVIEPSGLDYPKAPANDLSLNFSVQTEQVPTASGTALTVTEYTKTVTEGAFYAYEVTDVLVKNVKIDATKTNATKINDIAQTFKVTVKANQYITVYLIRESDGKILAYGSKQVTAGMLY